MIDIVFATFVFLSTLLYGVCDPAKNISWSLAKFNVFFLHMGAMVLFAASIFQEPDRKIKPMIPIALLGIGLLNVVFLNFDSLVMTSFVNLFFWTMGLYIAINYLHYPSKIKKYIVWAAVINMLVYVVQKFGWTPILNTSMTTGEEGGIMGNISQLSTFLAIALPFMPPVGMVFCIILGVVGKELGLLVSCAVLLLIKLYRAGFLTKPIDVSIGVIFLGAFLILDYLKITPFHLIDTLVNVSIFNRMNVWKGTVEMIATSPWVGFGLGVRPLAYINNAPTAERLDVIFSSMLQLVFSVGMAGGAWLIFAGKEFKKRFDFSPESLSVLVFIILCIFKYPVEIPRIWFTLMAVFALWIIKTEKVKYVYGD